MATQVLYNNQKVIHNNKEIESNDVNGANDVNDVSSIISDASSDFDPVREIAFQLGVEFIKYSEFEEIVPIKTEAKVIVKQAIWKEQSQKVALKQIIGANDEEIHIKLENEIMRALQNLDHDNLMQLYGVTEDIESNSCMLVLQLAKDGNLREYLAANPELPWINRLRIARDVSDGLRQLHKAGVIHGDLHARNVFINNGIAFIKAPRMISYDESNYNKSPELIPYIDPRLISNKDLRPERSSDIYSLGVLLWEISSGRPPFENYENQVRLTVSIMAKKTREQPSPNTPADYIKLYEDCWQHDPTLRLTIDEVCDKMDEFLKDDPLSAHRIKKRINSNDDDEFTFEEEPILLPRKEEEKEEEKEEKEEEKVEKIEKEEKVEKVEENDKAINGFAHLTNGNRGIKQNGSLNSETDTDNTFKKQKRSSKIFQTFKMDIRKTKHRLSSVWSKISCTGGGYVDDELIN
ncbi:hypothetical protein Glove_30g56 [Diversispora epigaea]|uniref:Protein kinase domain-containing protein n=1 Tax=Diversispora epigaea TaxID=1348612 RepID=A0A397JJG5_9GLOM|nr:hypothetical protein Glove_30g56 [Diversispora epigaea]